MERSLAEKEGANGGGVVKRGKGGERARRKKGKARRITVMDVSAKVRLRRERWCAVMRVWGGFTSNVWA